MVDERDKWLHLGEVTHVDYGNGVVIGVNKGKITVYFEDATRKFDFPETFERYELMTADDRIVRMIEQDAQGYDVKNILIKQKLESLKEKYPHIKKTKVRVKNNKRVVSNLYGADAQDIKFECVEDFVRSLACLAVPNNIYIEARVPLSKVDLFKETYPNQAYTVVYSTDRQDRGVECRMTVKNDIGITHTLQNHLQFSDMNNSIIKRINKTAFIFDLVDNYGFKFGAKQNFEDILAHVKEEYRNLFEELVIENMCS